MIDTLKLIIAGFSGKLDHDPAARKSVWILTISSFFALCCLFFAAYVSFSRYLDLVGFLPGAKYAAVCFTLAIAGFVFFASSFVATFCAERWIHGESNLHGGIALALLVVGVLVAIGDYQMNVDGASDVAKNAAGELVFVDSDAIRAKHQGRIDKLQADIDHIKDPNNPQYKWKGALIKSGRTQVDKLTSQIQSIENAIAQEIEREIEKVNRLNSDRDTREMITKDRLLIVVRWVFGIQFFLCMITSLLGTSMAQAMPEMSGHIVVRKKTPKKVIKKEKRQLEPVPSMADGGQDEGTSLYSKTSIGFTGGETKTPAKSPKTNKKRTRKARMTGGQVKEKPIREDTLQTMGRIVAAYNGLKTQNPEQNPTQKSIAKAAGVSPKTVSRHMKKIKTLNLMSMEG